MLLVVIVVLVFLQGWRTAIIPIIAIPVSLVGTFAVMAALGFSINNLTLFGLVLAVGIVVDDAIVVVENVERHLGDGMSRRDAALLTMDEVGGALISIALVLCAVFVPNGISSGAFPGSSSSNSPSPLRWRPRSPVSARSRCRRHWPR
jgi:multidrug efflux pump subunit AcrB